MHQRVQLYCLLCKLSTRKFLAYGNWRSTNGLDFFIWKLSYGNLLYASRDVACFLKCKLYSIIRNFFHASKGATLFLVMQVIYQKISCIRQLEIDEWG
ncbi:hypothetical protein L6452_36519 [Arctium lappa]|uniref:Uncharacterized protein n=1 Tax=Arctium lappa TaxID=4217 RepID=A0ACB8YA40_ARCLA|nr:hypothetical protein L6452_36519 [Arctium lappa]